MNPFFGPHPNTGSDDLTPLTFG